MIIYNVTINIDHAVHDEWLKWMKNIHIPEVMKTGIFLENRMLKVLGDEDSGGVTYSVQYTCRSLDDFKNYENQFANEIRKKHLDKYQDKFVAFRTLLEVVD
jgi:hypothetical protein